MVLLQANDIIVRRGDKVILDCPSLVMSDQDHLLLLGESGSGKTTLLSVLAGLLEPDSGQVLVDGIDLYTLSHRERDRLRGQLFGFVFQTLHLIPYLSVRQNVALASVMAGLPVDGTRVDHLLSRLGLGDKAQRKPASLSQGEAQRAAIARAVLNRPKLLIADEPSSALDDTNTRIVVDLLMEQARETQAGLLIATHDHRLVPQFSKTMTIKSERSAA